MWKHLNIKHFILNRFFQCNRKYKKLQYFPMQKKKSKGLSKHLTWFPWHFPRISQVKTQICVSHWLSAWVCWVFTLFSHLHLLVFLGFHFHSAEWRIQLFHKNSFFAFNFSHRNCTGKTKSARTKNVYFRIVLETHLHANIHTHTQTQRQTRQPMKKMQKEASKMRGTLTLHPGPQKEG